MERKYLKDLVNWMNDEDKKPLLVTGARQVGKTYLIKEEIYNLPAEFRIRTEIELDYIK